MKISKLVSFVKVLIDTNKGNITVSGPNLLIQIDNLKFKKSFNKFSSLTINGDEVEVTNKRDISNDIELEIDRILKNIGNQIYEKLNKKNIDIPTISEKISRSINLLLKEKY